MIDWTDFKIEDNVIKCDLRHKNKTNQLYGIEASLYNIDYIIQNYPPPYTLYLSGGVDSQAMLYAWVKSGKPFQTFSALYNFESNWYDLQTCKDFAKSLGVTLNYYNFDLINFLETEHDLYANKYKTGSPQFTTFIKLASLTTEGTVIFSGECPGRKEFLNPQLPPIVVPGNNQLCLYHYGKIENKPIVPWFFIETEMVAYSWKYSGPSHGIHFKKLSEEEQVPHQGKKTGYDTKVKIYHDNGYPVIPQEKKLNGFEKIKEMYDTAPPRQPSSMDKFAMGLNGSKRIFDLLYRNKYEDKMPIYSFMIQW